MKYCKLCVQPDTRPGIRFTDDGICYACVYAERRRRIDWNQRRAKLDDIVGWAKGQCAEYDCIVGASGGKDSVIQALVARDALGLKCLLVNCAPDNITALGQLNLENLVQHGFDMVSYRPNPVVLRRLTKQSFYEYGNPVKPSEYPLFAVTFQTAAKLRIPLIIQGENPALTLGTVEDLNPNDDAFGIIDCNTLAGGSLNIWLGEDVHRSDLRLYRFPTESELGKTRAIWLQYYWQNWSYSRNAEIAIQHGMKYRTGVRCKDIGRYNLYDNLDSDMQIVNQMLKYLKFGFGKTTDQVCYDIREGLMTREEGIEFIESYDGKCGARYIQEFCGYIAITEEEFWRVTDQWVNKKLFAKCADGEYIPKFKVGTDFENRL